MLHMNLITFYTTAQIFHCGEIPLEYTWNDRKPSVLSYTLLKLFRWSLHITVFGYRISKPDIELVYYKALHFSSSNKKSDYQIF